MFEPIDGLPDGVLGFEAVGTIQGADYTDTLVPALRSANPAGGVRLVLILGDRFDGYSPAAMTQDAGLVTGGIEWHRTALVSDLGWVTHLAVMFGWMIPGRFKRFAVADREAAIAWAADGDRVGEPT